MEPTTVPPIEAILTSPEQWQGQTIEIRGWVRTKRDSKAGFSFVNVGDGSCFDPIQVVVPSDLDNYEDEVRRLTSGCSVIVKGTVVESLYREIRALRIYEGASDVQKVIIARQTAGL